MNTTKEPTKEGLQYAELMAKQAGLDFNYYPEKLQFAIYRPGKSYPFISYKFGECLDYMQGYFHAVQDNKGV